jgi:hypothetical protein
VDRDNLPCKVIPVDGLCCPKGSAKLRSQLESTQSSATLIVGLKICRRAVGIFHIEDPYLSMCQSKNKSSSHCLLDTLPLNWTCA